MKKRLPILPTIVIGLVVMFLIGFITIRLVAKFDLPDWIIPVSGIMAVFSFFEIVGRLGPKAIETPSIKFTKLSSKDKIVVVLAILAYLIAAFPIGMSFDSVTLKLLSGVFGLLAFCLIYFSFGSKELRQWPRKE